MAKHKISKVDGHYLEGAEVTVDSEINFLDGAPIIDSSSGDFKHTIKTNAAAAYKVQGDTSGTDVILVDSTAGSEKVTLNADLEFATTANPEIDTTGGGFIWKMITALATAWKLRDDTKGQDIITIDTSTDTVTANNADYTFVGFYSNIAFTIQSANYNAVANDWVDMTTGATDKSVTFPASPVVNDRIKISKADAGAGNVTIDGNGNNINGATSDLITNQYTVYTYQYNGTEWRKY